MKIRNKIGKRIRDLRQERVLTQDELAASAKISTRTVQNIESGAFSARIDVLGKIADVLECDINFVKK